MSGFGRLLCLLLALTSLNCWAVPLYIDHESSPNQHIIKASSNTAQNSPFLSSRNYGHLVDLERKSHQSSPESAGIEIIFAGTGKAQSTTYLADQLSMGLQAFQSVLSISGKLTI
jgi:hypothetical protein